MNSRNKNILSFNSLSDANDALLELFSELPKPISRILLSGGSTPISFYELLSKKDINWSNYLISLSDERRVEVSGSLSNEGTIKRIIYDHSFNNSFVSLLDDDSESKLNSIASYDLCILGMGNDGHIASIFPNMSNLEEALYGKASLLNLYDGYPDVSRVTMSLNEINKSDQIILLVKGEKKFNLLMDERANNNLLPVDHLFTQMINKIKVFKII
ncbi:MAG: 6-phosphogluconolactonase [SAR86 cluster bacterium]|uniref:6-phosphogluconolactonase n=1 Tax=SAR86 cluster bacterium TaxID=2030880 RepID=A0A937JEY6_9GAMM|nr:6-phosphogluconolactonase [SAR86 cluster bacterium]